MRSFGAGVAELADAQDLGSCGRKAVGVQIPPSAPTCSLSSSGLFCGLYPENDLEIDYPMRIVILSERSESKALSSNRKHSRHLEIPRKTYDPSEISPVLTCIIQTTYLRLGES